MDKTFSAFGLTLKQTQVLFGLEYQLISDDIAFTTNKKDLIINMTKRASEKKRWSSNWELSINKYLQGLGDKSLPDSEEKVASLIKECDGDEEVNSAWKYLILLECCCYNAYTPLGGTKEEIEKSAKDFARLKIEKGSRQATLKRICGLLNIDEKYIDIFQSSLKNANKRLNGYWKKVVVGSAIGVVIIAIAVATGRYRILALLAPEGLSGAAAISAGLAALGGGAVAAGGYGMAGGIAVLVGGGSLLGIGAGGSMGILLASKNSNVLLSDAAKLEVVLKEIVIGVQKDTTSFQKILNKLAEQKEELRKKVEELQTQSDQNKKEIKELKKSLSYLEKVIKDMQLN
jgi:hypothetical protein